MNPRRDEIKRDDRHVRQHRFHKGLTQRAVLGFGRAMHTMEEFRSGDGRQSHLLSCVRGQEILEAQPSALDVNEHAGVDQRCHGEEGTGG